MWPSSLCTSRACSKRGQIVRLLWTYLFINCGEGICGTPYAHIAIGHATDHVPQRYIRTFEAQGIWAKCQTVNLAKSLARLGLAHSALLSSSLKNCLSQFSIWFFVWCLPLAQDTRKWARHQKHQSAPSETLEPIKKTKKKNINSIASKLGHRRWAQKQVLATGAELYTMSLTKCAHVLPFFCARQDFSSPILYNWVHRWISKMRSQIEGCKLACSGSVGKEAFHPNKSWSSHVPRSGWYMFATCQTCFHVEAFGIVARVEEMDFRLSHTSCKDKTLPGSEADSKTQVTKSTKWDLRRIRTSRMKMTHISSHMFWKLSGLGTFSFG